MSLLSVTPLQPAGLTSVNPSIIYVLTSDTYATVTATGYLTASAQLGNTYNNEQMAIVYTTDNGPVWLKVVITYSNATVLSSVISLVELTSPGDVVLPTIANHIIVSTNTSGTLANLTGTAINNGSVQAGLSGTAGTLISYPGTASKGSLILAAVANTGNTNTTISNDAMGQASVISIPDPANAAGQFLIGATATPFVSGNFPENSGTAGLMIDSGVSFSSISSAITQLGQLQQISVTLNTAAVIAAYATPQVLIPAAAGKVAVIISANVYTNSTGNTPFATGTAPIIQYGTTVHGGGTIAVNTGLVTGDIEAAASQIRTLGPAASTTYTGITDTPVTFSCATAYTSGTGTSITFTLVYQLITATV